MKAAGFFLGIWLLVLVAVGSVAAQQPPAPQGVQAQVSAAPTGSVTGTVLAQDNQKPVRFAQVTLQSVESVANASGGGRFGGGAGGGGAARTEFDGTFTVSGIAPGDYYVTASALGFIPERALLLTAVNNGADPAQLLAGLPVVHVAADSTSTVNVTLQRGGALSGRVVWEDGSAAAAVTVAALPVPASGVSATTQLPAPLSGLQLNGFGELTQTDDRGSFRISGVPSGDYQLQATVQTGARAAGPGGFGGGLGGGRGAQAPSVIRVFAPGVFRKSAAKSFSVRAGDERTDIQMTIDLRSLRTVSGHANSANTGQTVASGRVSVVDADDPTLQLQGAIDAEGDFTVRYVPPGNYTLQISGASTQPPAQFGRGRGGNSGSTTPATTFQPLSLPIVVTDADLSGITATLIPAQGH
jgi:hypothetical protein